MRCTFQENITNLSPSQPSTDDEACYVSYAMTWCNICLLCLGRRVSWIASYAHHMTMSAAYKLISGSHGYHTPTMFGAYTLPAEAAVWLCIVKATRKGIPCVSVFTIQQQQVVNEVWESAMQQCSFLWQWCQPVP